MPTRRLGVAVTVAVLAAVALTALLVVSRHTLKLQEVPPATPRQVVQLPADVWGCERPTVQPSGLVHVYCRTDGGGETVALVQPDGAIRIITFRPGSTPTPYPRVPAAPLPTRTQAP